ncbi:hypothetical protein F5B19DRAFT_21671 [Rostrohypoxylon terebratum]|nr:hypothetical protein F5B19DRAFT_21671 [Rostrohypoxylon terebratum]
MGRFPQHVDQTWNVTAKFGIYARLRIVVAWVCGAGDWSTAVSSRCQGLVIAVKIVWDNIGAFLIVYLGRYFLP